MQPDCFLETTGQDWANHLSTLQDSNGIICLAALLNGHPDEELLSGAVAGSIAMQPVLGCRFDVSQDPPVWTPLFSNTSFFKVIKASDMQTALDDFIREDMGDRQLDVRLACCAGQTALLVKLSHASCDGGGAMALLLLINRLYNAGLVGESKEGGMAGDRSDRQVFDALGISDIRHLLQAAKPAQAPPVTFPYRGLQGRTVRHASISVPLDGVRRIPSATVTDALLAGIFRALEGRNGAPSLHMTVDLRRYLSGGPPIACNLSGIEAVEIGAPAGDGYWETLGRVVRATSAIKAGRPGLSSAAAMAFLRTLPYEKAKAFLLDAGRKVRESGASAPLLSNLGMVAGGELSFGECTVTGILPLLPAMHAPAFMIGACGYRNALVLSAGFYEEERAVSDVENFLARIAAEVTGS